MVQEQINYDAIKQALIKKRVRFRSHSAQMLIERNISKNEVFQTILNGEIIEEYLKDRPFPSCLVFALHDKRPIHVVCSYNSIDDIAIIITVYIPDSKFFENDFKTRRK